MKSYSPSSCRSLARRTSISSVTGFDPHELDALLVAPEEAERENATPPLPESPVSRLGDLVGRHRLGAVAILIRAQDEIVAVDGDFLGVLGLHLDLRTDKDGD